ncbi:hypothetical protein FF38_01672 [Lucilia cuprina]|uniref:Uncharacterized protein n=1 Tax=Lucilia cuprina TaxID=7375 RepID=A0A0L0C448_LUCCU|nr:hypothetical protein FF38_01672 [Lucilia cuprina]
MLPPFFKAVVISRGGPYIGDRPHNAKDGDHLVLTKPLGTQLATNAYLWLKERNDKYLMLAEQFTDDDIKETYQTAVNTMAYLNKTVVYLSSEIFKQFVEKSDFLKEGLYLGNVFRETRSIQIAGTV